MKKFLALVLALVMTMSLVTISAGAEDFTDDSKITYGEAVDVMTAVGVVGGYADGSFNPTAGLTRGAAAKIICNMLLGPTTAEALSANDAPFSDVAVDNVFAGYIAYCVNEGIISGYADGTFRPAAPLTGYAFMKMLLGALGYDAAIEGYTGTNWSIQVAKRALNVGLDAGLEGDFVGAKALTREEACLYAFNTLKADMVKYDNKSTISVGDLVITQNSEASVITDDDKNETKIWDETDVDTLQFAEKYFNKLAYTASDADTFGRPAHSWDYDKEDVGTYVDEPAFVFTAYTEAKDIAPELKGYKFWEDADTDGVVDAGETFKVENDTDYTKTFKVAVSNVSASGKATGAALSVSAMTLAEKIEALTANGKLVELYANDDEIFTDLVAMNYSVAKFTKVTENKAGDLTYTIGGTNYVDYADDDLKTDTIAIYGDIAKGEYVTYVKVGAKAHVWATEYVVGAQSDIDNYVTITVDGVEYDLQNNALGSYVNSKTEYKYFLDQYGYVVATDSAAVASTNYAYVVNNYTKLTTGLSGSVPSVEARVVLADGSIKDVTVAVEEMTGTDKGDYKITNLSKIYDNAYTAATAEATTKGNVNTALNGKVFGYTLDGDTITFEALTTLPGASEAAAEETVYFHQIVGMTEGTVRYVQYSGQSKTILMDKSTVFVAYDTTNNKAAVYTGVSNLPSDFDGTTGLTVLTTGTTTNLGTANVVFMTKAGGYTAAAVEDYVFIDSSKWTESGVGADKVWKYVGTDVEGNPVDLTAATKLTETTGVYTYSTDLKVTDSNKQTGAQFVDATGADMTVEGNLVCAGGNYYYMTDDTAVVYIDEDLSSVDGSKGWVVLAMDGSTVTNDVETIYVIAD